MKISRNIAKEIFLDHPTVIWYLTFKNLRIDFFSFKEIFPNSFVKFFSNSRYEFRDHPRSWNMNTHTHVHETYVSFSYATTYIQWTCKRAAQYISVPAYFYTPPPLPPFRWHPLPSSVVALLQARIPWDTASWILSNFPKQNKTGGPFVTLVHSFLLRLILLAIVFFFLFLFIPLHWSFVIFESLPSYFPSF